MVSKKRKPKQDYSPWTSFHQSAEHYNLMIWAVFAAAIALSLWILDKVWTNKALIGITHFSMAILGFLVLFYGILTIESFGQKKDLLYKLYNKKLEEVARIDLDKLILDLPYRRPWFLAEISLLFILFLYIVLFCYMSAEQTLTINGINEMLLQGISWTTTFISLLGTSIIIVNWIRRIEYERIRNKRKK